MCTDNIYSHIIQILFLQFKNLIKLVYESWKKFYYEIGMVVKKTPHNWKFQIEIVYIVFPNMVPTEKHKSVKFKKNIFLYTDLWIRLFCAIL